MPATDSIRSLPHAIFRGPRRPPFGDFRRPRPQPPPPPPAPTTLLGRPGRSPLAGRGNRLRAPPPPAATKSTPVTNRSSSRAIRTSPSCSGCRWQELIEEAPQGEPHRLCRHQAAGPHLPHPQGAGEAQRPDVRRRHAGGAARRLRLPPQPRLSLSFLPGRHLRVAQPDPPLRPEDRGHGLRPDPSAQGERAVLRPVARRGDQLRGPEPVGLAGALRRSDAAAPRRADPHGDHGRGSRHAGGRPDRAHRLRPAGADRQPAAGRQDDPHAEDGQGRA